MLPNPTNPFVTVFKVGLPARLPHSCVLLTSAQAMGLGAGLRGDLGEAHFPLAPGLSSKCCMPTQPSNACSRRRHTPFRLERAGLLAPLRRGLLLLPALLRLPQRALDRRFGGHVIMVRRWAGRQEDGERVRGMAAVLFCNTVVAEVRRMRTSFSAFEREKEESDRARGAAFYCHPAPGPSLWKLGGMGSRGEGVIEDGLQRPRRHFFTFLFLTFCSETVARGSHEPPAVTQGKAQGVGSEEKNAMQPKQPKP